MHRLPELQRNATAGRTGRRDGAGQRNGIGRISQIGRIDWIRPINQGATVNNIGQSERATQDWVIALFSEELGYRYLGDWTDRPNNSNIEVGLLTAYLTKRGYSPSQISRAFDRLTTEAGNPNRSLYDNNKAVYGLLRYGVDVKIEAGRRRKRFTW